MTDQKKMSYLDKLDFWLDELLNSKEIEMFQFEKDPYNRLKQEITKKVIQRLG